MARQFEHNPAGEVTLTPEEYAEQLATLRDPQKIFDTVRKHPMIHGMISQAIGKIAVIGFAIMPKSLVESLPEILAYCAAQLSLIRDVTLREMADEKDQLDTLKDIISQN
jgi:hypothetical protein